VFSLLLGDMMDHKKRVNVMHGLEVDIVLKKNQKGQRYFFALLEFETKPYVGD